MIWNTIRSISLTELKYRRDGACVVRNGGVEKCLDNDLHRETRHVARDVAPFTGPPTRNRAFRILDHHVAVRADALPVKSRLGQASLTSPEVPFASHQSIANEAMEEW